MSGLADALAGFSRSAFRLETLEAYDVPEETDRLAAYLDGDALTPRTPQTDDWLAFVAATTDAERTMSRVHVVREPLSAYLRYELACYVENEAAGEQVGLAVADSDSPEAAGLDVDFWLFDDAEAWVMRYDDQGRFLGADLADDPAPYRLLRDRALSLAVPLSHYLVRHGGP